MDSTGTEYRWSLGTEQAVTADRGEMKRGRELERETELMDVNRHVFALMGARIFPWHMVQSECQDNVKSPGMIEREDCEGARRCRWVSRACARGNVRENAVF